MNELMIVTVLGTGTIGSTVAYTLASEGVSVRMADVDEEKNRGHAIDIRHSLGHAGHSLGREIPTGEVIDVPTGVDAVAGSDCLVVTASAPRPGGANRRGGRAEWLETNLEIIQDVATWLAPNQPCPVIVVTNPVDVLTYHLFTRSGWPSRHFLGYSLSETARLASILAQTYDVPYREIYCPVLGEHGEHLVPVFSRTTVGGTTVDLTESDRQTLLDRVREAPYEVISLRGGDESSRWVTGRGVALLAHALISGGVSEPVGLSTPLDSEYGYEDVSLGVPVTLDGSGVDQIVEWELSPWERDRMDDASRSVQSRIPDSRGQ